MLERVLLIIAKLLTDSKLKFLHETVRRLVEFLFFPLFSVLFQLITGVRPSLRNSARAKGRYHLLFSDWDVSVVVAHEASVSFVSRVYKGFRRLVPPLGELEIYLPVELEELNRLLSRQGDVYHKLRKYRKLGVLRRRLFLEQREFGRLKLERAIGFLSQELGLEGGHWATYFQGLTEVCQSLVKSKAQALPALTRDSDYFLYFDQRIFFADSLSGEWAAPERLWAQVLRLSPVGMFESPSLRDWWSAEGEADQELAELRRVLARIEFLVSQAAFRGDSELELGNWLDTLDAYSKWVASDAPLRSLIVDV